MTDRRRTVAVIGNGEVLPESPQYEIGRQVGGLLCDRGFHVATGGLGGIMEAASRGARESKAWTHGTVIALLPGTTADDANPYVDIIIPTGLGHLRNALVARTDAVIAIGGGAGTLTEIALAWLYGRLIVALRVDGWSGELADRRVDVRIRHTTIPDDRVFGASDATEAVDIVSMKIDAYVRSGREQRPLS